MDTFKKKYLPPVLTSYPQNPPFLSGQLLLGLLPAASQTTQLAATDIIIIITIIMTTKIMKSMTMTIMINIRMDAERKAKEMAVLVADLQRMRSETARNAVSFVMIRQSREG